MISEFFLLSAAHCENDRENGPAAVAKLGAVNLKDSGPNAQLIPISQFTKHPSYKTSEKYNDIALIQLQNKIEFNEFVRPACLNTEPLDTLHWKQAIASGFGKTQYGLSIKYKLISILSIYSHLLIVVAFATWALIYFCCFISISFLRK